MNNEMDKLDDLFRKGLEDPVDKTSYREPDWESLQQMLDEHKKRRGIVYWWPILSGVAALLLLFLGWWLFVPKANNQGNGQQAVIRHQSAPANTIEKPAKQPGHKQVSPDVTQYAKNNDHNNSNNQNSNKANSGGKSATVISAGNTPREDAGNNQNDTGNRQFAEALVAVSDKPAIEQINNAYQVNSMDLPRSVNNPSKGSDVSKNDKNKIKIKTGFRPQFALTVLGAPDISGVGSFQQGKVGTNFGLSFSAGVVKKISVSAGVVYSDKPYLTAFANYHTPYKFPTEPDNVRAECRMLDIPININYQVYHKNQNMISFGTGLSSYIMVDQNYQFNYADPYTVGPKKFNVAGNDKYLFEILNFTATYQHQLTPKVGVSVQPYYKLPLADIGYSQVRLQTAGVAFGLTWNINAISKN